jgi:hypothetical protein
LFTPLAVPGEKVMFYYLLLLFPSIYSMNLEPVQQTQLESYQSSEREIETRDKGQTLSQP